MTLSIANWERQPPNLFDIVSGFYPETKPIGADKLRPCLVLRVMQSEDSAEYACKVAYGTTNTKIFERADIDLIICNASKMQSVGLPRATRFNLDKDCLVLLPWNSEFFGCWQGYPTPIIGRLDEDLIKDYGYCMMKRAIVS